MKTLTNDLNKKSKENVYNHISIGKRFFYKFARLQPKNRYVTFLSYFYFLFFGIVQKKNICITWKEKQINSFSKKSSNFSNTGKEIIYIKKSTKRKTTKNSISIGGGRKWKGKKMTVAKESRRQTKQGRLRESTNNCETNERERMKVLELYWALEIPQIRR